MDIDNIKKEMDKKLQLKSEIAKSWFILAQILIILAGFFFATSSMSFTNAQNNLATAIDLYSGNVKFIDSNLKEFPELIEKNNLTNKYISHLNQVADNIDQIQQIFEGLSVKNKDDAEKYRRAGIIFAVLSLLVFIYGKYRLHKLKTIGS